MTADILAAFDRFKALVDRVHDAARDRLAHHDLTGAQAMLARIGHTHAKAALLLGKVTPPCITCGKDEHDGTEDHPMARTDTLND
ncbi:hypothetical protein SAMN05443287_106187 [Micromonospora phaseoli]|uniref:Uncharacterized protein n=1 Tax=Micromonospora phaseoli TaxID=1144548 RepID=A0A1H7AKN7_9ACTN|nr:hypothetical protein [Micromonospora phaseoli]PZV96323.1 hypothetical protein CLV64_107201 [Micromonospora phaseoli]GIJ76009.1 hypothetical protein Xph01_04410 [Micromonospora phaseoli]SEJ65918.1 hypothetical protein SAMN05443287_106187 [Micromonospora phaseoli]